MNWLDIVILLIISIFALLGFRRGLIKEIISIVAIVGAILTGVIFYAPLEDLIIKHTLIKSEAIASISGFLLILFITYLLIKLIGSGLAEIIGTLNLSWFDRICGFCFGAIKGVIISFLIITALGFFLSEKEPPFTNSIFVPYIKETLSIIKGVIPNEFNENIEKVKKVIQEKGIKGAIKEVEKVKETYLKEIGKEKEPEK
jgi:membrane protein required for colicin V production